MPDPDDRYPQPNAKFRHLYVVARVDLYFPGGRIEDLLALTKAFVTEVEARREMERLNEVNADKRCYYVYKVVRLVEGVSDS